MYTFNKCYFSIHAGRNSGPCVHLAGDPVVLLVYLKLRAKWPSSQRDLHWCSVQDYAGGMSEQALQMSQHFFVSTVVPSEPTYAYSKHHGVTFSGLGVGLPMASLYVEYMGGSLTLDQHEGAPGKGTCVTIRLPVDGFDCV